MDGPLMNLFIFIQCEQVEWNLIQDFNKRAKILLCFLCTTKFMWPQQFRLHLLCVPMLGHLMQAVGVLTASLLCHQCIVQVIHYSSLAYTKMNTRRHMNHTEIQNYKQRKSISPKLTSIGWICSLSCFLLRADNLWDTRAPMSTT